MRIGIVTTWFERGAAYVSRQYQQALEAQHEVFIYARGGEAKAQGDPLWDSDRVTWARGTRLKNIPTAMDLREFAAWLRDCKIDVVFFNEQFCWDPVIYCAERGVLSGAYIDYYTEKTIPFFALHDFLICNTVRHQQAFDWHPHAHYVRWGTDLDLFQPQLADSVPSDKVTFFHSAGMSPHRKGTDIFIRALALLAHLPVCGLVHSQVPVKSVFPELAATIDMLQAAGRLSCVERTIAAPGLYHQGDVYVYPTRLDGLGLTVVEALACGLPTIAPDQAPMNEFVRQGINGRLTPVDRIYSRWDGYYWPQCTVAPDALARDMQWYADRRLLLPALKQATRESALAQHRWTDRQGDLSLIFESARPLSPAWRAQALAQVKAFEQGRSDSALPSGIAYLAAYLHDNHPPLFNAIRAAKGLVRA